uniref:non-specific serine/threonine protein kinase n=1 Tax=Erpetoichthys calabaricus TaxID=27687 RepID=A0A8C4SX02_ERPCA
RDITATCFSPHMGDALPSQLNTIKYSGNVWLWSVPTFHLCLPQEIPEEVSLMQLVCAEPTNPGIIQLLDWYRGPREIVIVMELMESSVDLSQFVKMQRSPLSETQVRNIFRQIVKAVQHCHSRGVFHRDIKPKNILIQIPTEQIKLIDFGSGTWLYAPPECVARKSYAAVPTTVWSLGVTLYMILCGHLPFKTSDEIIKYRFNITRDLSEECEDLIRQCLSFSPKWRPTLEDILVHQWLC